jgi:ribose transport system ATP-binding protein
MLQLKEIKKSFGGVKALKGVNLQVKAGEIHALLGENGAGKSTLMKVISGAHTADSGTIVFNGETIVHNSPHIARQHGISIIYQEFSLVPELSVTENIFLGSTNGNWLNRRRMNKEAADIIHALGFKMDVSKKILELPVASQQIVEIARALSQQVKLLILDEPSAVLGTQEVKKLFTLLRKLKDDGVAVIYISHHLEELFELTDRITVLKDGKTVTTVITKETNKDILVSLMVGRALSQMYPDKIHLKTGAESIRVENLVTSKKSEPLSFEISKGEILGIGGLVGSGRTEVLEALFGLNGATGATITINGMPAKVTSPGAAIRQGWGMVPEDRKKFGGLLNLSIRHNISLANLSRVSNRWGFISREKEDKIVNELMKRLQVKFGGINDPLLSLSGGNQQKVVLAKWLNPDLKVLLVDEPTRGVDVGARAEIYQIIRQLANQGIYILMVSSDMEELMAMSDRIMVLKNGQLQGTLGRKDFNEETILRLAIEAN